VALGLIHPDYAALGLTAGLGVGAVFFFRVMMSGRGIMDLNLKPDPDRPKSPDSRISMGLAAAGIGCSGYMNPHYYWPAAHWSFLAAAILGAVIALFTAWRSMIVRPIVSEVYADKDTDQIKPLLPKH